MLNWWHSLCDLPGHMSPAGRALHRHFEGVCRSELQRLRRKTASLTPDQREAVDALTVAVAQGMASRLDAALETPGTSDLAPLVIQLFAVSNPPMEERS